LLITIWLFTVVRGPSSFLVKRWQISMADTISTLPDAVLCHILSFLETKQVVATSILSNRWKHLWLSVPVLDFGLTRLTDKDANFRFNDFVYSVLLSRDAAVPIKSFRLYVIYNYSGRVNLCIPSFAKWINFVLQRGVEYLDLNVDIFGWRTLPNTIFNCTTLVVLRLHFFWIDPSCSSILLLPSLKTLHLDFITFPKHQDFMSLLANCPNLEDLIISDLWFDYAKDSPSFDYEEDSLSCSKWKNLSLSNLTKADVDSTYFHFPMKVLQNVQSLSMCILTAQVWFDLFSFLPFFVFGSLTMIWQFALLYFRCIATMMLFLHFIIWLAWTLTLSIIVGIS